VGGESRTPLFGGLDWHEGIAYAGVMMLAGAAGSLILLVLFLLGMLLSCPC